MEGPGKLYKHVKKSKKKESKRNNWRKNKILVDLLNKEVKLESKDLPAFDIESEKSKSEANC